MTRRIPGALCGLISLLAITPSLAFARQALPVSQSRSTQDSALEALKMRTLRAGRPFRVYDGPFGTPRYLSGSFTGAKAAGVSFEGQARAFLSSQHGLFDLDVEELELTRSVEDRVGGRHLKFAQTYQGLPVFGADLVVHLDRSGVVEGVNGTAVADLRMNTEPVLEPEDIEGLVSAWMGDRLIDLSEAELGIYPMRSGSRLVWRVAATLEGLPRILFIDARTGELVWSKNPMYDLGATGSGVDVDGNQYSSLPIQKGKIFPTSVTPLFNVYIQNAKKGAYNLDDLTTKDLGYIYTFTANETFLQKMDYVSSPDNSFDDASKNNNMPSGVSADVAYRTTLDFYHNLFNRSGIDDKGLNISAVVEVNGIPGEPLQCNAGWVGEGYDFMMFGMGGDCGALGEMKPFSAGLDVIGHELTHGVDEFTINLGYDHEAGALNEHLSDVFGVLDEAYAGNPNWLIGEDLPVNPTPPYDAFRSFSDPTQYYVNSTTKQPDMMSKFYICPVSYDAGGVHFNSGIVNKAFYLAVHGGSFNGVNVTPLGTSEDEGRKIGGEIWYDIMNSMRISNKSQFNDFRDALIAATQKLYPSKVTSIQQAFQAVGVVDDLYPTASQDKNEPNDYPQTAAPIAVGGSATNLIWDRNDTDLYALDLGANQTVTITLSGLTFEAQMNLYSVGPYQTLKAEASSDNAGTADESITFTSKGSNTVYIEVVPNLNRGSRTAPYTVTVTKG